MSRGVSYSKDLHAISKERGEELLTLEIVTEQGTRCTYQGAYPQGHHTALCWLWIMLLQHPELVPDMKALAKAKEPAP